MPGIELVCFERTDHGMHSWQPEGPVRGRVICPGWWPRPRDNKDWPLTRRPRWVAKDQYWAVHEGGCHYCGQYTGEPGRDHLPAQCALCGSVQCHRGESCHVCYAGFLPGYRPGETGICGYTGCGRPAVAKAPKIRRVCRGCAPRVTIIRRGQRLRLDTDVTEALAVRDSGKAPNRWRLVA
jgi:hypothetical protein